MNQWSDQKTPDVPLKGPLVFLSHGLFEGLEDLVDCLVWRGDQLSYTGQGPRSSGISLTFEMSSPGTDLCIHGDNLTMNGFLRFLDGLKVSPEKFSHPIKGDDPGLII